MSDVLERAPPEIQHLIASNLSSGEIRALCRGSKQLLTICNDDMFWRLLIASRYPLYPGDVLIEHPEPHRLINTLETSYTLLVPSEGKLVPLHLDEAGLKAAVLLDYLMEGAPSLGDYEPGFTIITPDGSLLPSLEQVEIIRNFYEGDIPGLPYFVIVLNRIGAKSIEIDIGVDKVSFDTMIDIMYLMDVLDDFRLKVIRGDPSPLSGLSEYEDITPDYYRQPPE